MTCRFLAAALLLLSRLAAVAAGENAGIPAAPTPAQDRPAAIGSVATKSFPSPTLGKDLSYTVYLPAGYDAAKAARYPVVYFLHGRGDAMKAWLTVKTDLDALIASGRIPPLIGILPDASSSRRAGYYVDSRFTGNPGENPLPPGERVESAFTRDLVGHVDRTYATRADRAHRVIAGYSMGGYGAMRLVLVHPDLYAAAIVLSPAVYTPLPPESSSTREFGAFGNGPVIFDPAVYRENNYPAVLPGFIARGLPIAMFIAAGDNERVDPKPEEASHDIDYEAHTLFNRLRRVPGIATQFRVVGGHHDWDTWRPTFVEGIQYVFRAQGDRSGR